MESTNRKRSSAKLILLAAILGCISISFLISCNDSTGPAPYTLPARYFKDSVEPIFATNCIACHAPGGYGWGATGGDNGGLDLVNGYDSLYNRVSYEYSSAPDMVAHLRVKPGLPDSSFLYVKISKADPGYGNQMPLGGDPLSAGDMAIIKKWIQYGAPRGDTTSH